MKTIILFSILLNIAIIGQDAVINEKVIDDKIELKILPLKKQNDQLEKKLLIQNKVIDSLDKKLYDYEKLLFNIADSLKINTSNFQIMKSETDQQIDNINESISRQALYWICLLYTSPSPRDRTRYRMPSSA